MAPPAAAAAPPASGRVRWIVCGLLFLAVVLSYVDRQVLSVLKPTLQKSYGWTETGYGDVVFWFQAAYGLGYVAFGRIVDRIGARAGFAVAVTLWTVGQMAHALVRSTFGFAIARVPLALGESGAFPASLAAATEWFPQRERAFAIGLFNAGTNVGAVVAPLLVPVITLTLGWRMAFILTGLLTVIWLAAWLLFYRRPAEHPKVSAAELAYIQSDPAPTHTPVPWRRLLATRETWAYVMGRFLIDPVWWTFLFWLPDFFNRRYGVDMTAFGPPLVAIYVLADIGSVLGGWGSSRLLKAGLPTGRARKLAMLACALIVTPVAFASAAPNLWIATLLIGLATAGHQGFSANVYALPSDLFPRWAVGSVVGLGGLSGALGGMLMAKYAGWILQTVGSYQPIFVAAAGAYLVALLVIHLITPAYRPARFAGQEASYDMAEPLILHPDRLFPADASTRAIARRLHAEVDGLPIVSPHGHTDPAWFAYDEAFPNPADLLITPDHYVLRMLYSQGVSLESLGVARLDGGPVETDPRAIWRRFAGHDRLFRGTPSRLWHDWVYARVFGLTERLGPDTADHYYDVMQAALARPDFRPRALADRFNIEVIATTESPLDPLDHHRRIRETGWAGRVITAFRPDPVLDPETPGFHDNIAALGEITGEDTGTYTGYLRALENRRAFFRAAGATSTDHGHPSAFTADLTRAEAEDLFADVLSGPASPADAELFRGHMLMEMARMSLDDGMVMQIHPGVLRSHNPWLLDHFGRDKGADIPVRTDYVRALKPLLDRYGNDPRLTLILFTLDETTYARELAPLAGHYPALRLGPPWWFHDSPEGMRRFREQATETAGFYNTVGFNDDTRAFLSIPARHDVARRMDCAFLARLVVEHRLDEDEAHEVAHALSYGLVKAAYRL